MSELVPSLDVQHPLTLLERRMYGHLFDHLLFHCSPKVVGFREGSFGTRDVVCADDLGCMLCCFYDLVWNLKTYLRIALNILQVRLLLVETTAPIH